MNINIKKLIIPCSIALVLITAVFIVFNLRAPVLIVSEQYFISLYGEKRLKNEVFRSSLKLFRPVKIVSIANDAGDDIAPYAIAEISKKPYCVLFPHRFVRSARLYHEQNPEIPIVLLEEKSPGINNPPNMFVFGTDIESDYYKIGRLASILAGEEIGEIAVFLASDRSKDAFLRGINEEGAQHETVFFTSTPEDSEISASCIILAGTGGGILDRISGIPVIAYSWLDPSMLSGDVVLVIDDSPLAQVVMAVKLVTAGERRALIPSKFIVSNSRYIDKGLLHKINKIR